jgi:hypothetical protein
MPFRTGPGPTGGGLVPLEAGAVKTDPWGKPLGYCVWDHGKKTVSDNVAACGGSSANRLQGGNTSTESVLAIISAGKDGIFQTTCNAYVDANTDKIADTPLIVTAPDSDDIVKRDTIESLLASGALAQLPDLPDSACNAGAEGTMRYTNGVPQVCTSTGWKEVGGDSDGSPVFNSSGPVNPNTVQTSGTITTSGYFGTRKVSVDNGGTLVVNGLDTGLSSYDVPVGATVAIKGTSAAFPADPTSTATTPKVFTMKIGAVSKTWTLTTRGRTIASFSITPNPSNGMDVVGISGTAFGTPVHFTLTNTGEVISDTINALSFSNPTNFEVTGTNLCSNYTVAGGATCTFYVRPKASGAGAISGTVTASATGATSGVATLNGNATGWTCSLPWGGTIPNGSNVTAYNTATNLNCASVSQNRVCTDGNLSGTYTYQTCNAPTLVSGTKTTANCTAAGGTVYTISGTQYICRFNGANCPGGWSAYQQWSAANSNSCSGFGCEATSCTNFMKPWSNGAVGPGCTYYSNGIMSYGYCIAKMGYFCAQPVTARGCV